MECIDGPAVLRKEPSGLFDPGAQRILYTHMCPFAVFQCHNLHNTVKSG